MPSPDSVLTVLEAFRPEFSPRTWPRVITLILGTILARGRRTVAAALRQMGLHDRPAFSSYHQVFNRAAWSPLRVARRLLSAAIAALVPEGGGLTFAIDETLERRWGKKIRIRGHYRDPLASSKERSVSASGIRWIVLALVVTVPWASRPWALPILSLPSPTPKVSLKLGRRHKTIAERARQMIACLRRWLPMADLTVVGDSAYSVIELGLASRRRAVRLIAPLRLDARLFTPAPQRVPGTVGRPRVAGDRLPNLDVVLAAPETAWSSVAVRWYDGAVRDLEHCSVKNFQQEVLVPTTTPPFHRQALSSRMLLQQREREPVQPPYVLAQVPLPDARLVLPVGDVQAPMARVLDPPMAPDGVREPLHAYLEAADVVAHLV